MEIIGLSPLPHTITAISPQLKNQNRVNISIDGNYSCSLDISQLADLKIKVGQKLTPSELADLKRASDFGKLYTRALEYTFLRPHSIQEVRDYLRRKTQDRFVRVKDPKTGSFKTVKKAGFDPSLIDPILKRLKERGYLDDEKFAHTWVENRGLSRGISKKRLTLELRKKGISNTIISQTLSVSSRDDIQEIAKIIAKKRTKYAADPQKLIQYLVRQGFDYESAKTAVLEMGLQS